jgi:hypothetical protein
VPPTRILLIRTVMAGLTVGLLFVGVFLAAMHDPRPHRLPVTLVGTEPQVAGIRAGISRATGDAFDVRITPDRAAAVDSLRHRDTFAVYEPAARVVTVAGANGPAVTQTVTGLFGAVAGAGAAGALRVDDAVPLPRDDSRGLSTFYVAFGAVLAGFLTAVAGAALPVTVRPRQRYAALAGFAVVLAAGITLLADPVVGALPGAPVELLVVTALLAAAVATTGTAIIQLLGPAAGTGVASLLLLILGNATSGATLPASYLPALLRPLHDVLPVGVAVDAIIGAVHFADAGLVKALLVLTGWALLGAAGIARAHRRAQSDGPAGPGPTVAAPVTAYRAP